MELIHNNSSHSNYYRDDYFEWWYFHFLSREMSVNVVLHETDIFGQARSPYVSISMLIGDSPPIYRKIILEDGSISRDGRYLKVDNSGINIKETREALSLDLVFDSKTRFTGEIQKGGKKLIINDGILLEEPGGRRNYWVVMVPHGTFKVDLYLNDEKHGLSGSVYHDHQWGNLLIQKIVLDWTWGHFSDSKTSLVYFKILTKNGDIINRFGILSKGQMTKGKFFRGTNLNELMKSFKLLEFRGDSCIDFSDGRLFKFQIKPDNIMRSRVNEKYPDFIMSYLRWAVEGTLENEDIRRNIKGIVEYLRIEK